MYQLIQKFLFFFKAQTAHGLHSPLVFELYTMDGKIIQTRTFSKATQINVADFASGLYLYTVKNKDQAIIKKATINIAH